MTDAQIMVKISDEVLAFELDQPRHATSLQISCFLQINTGYSKVGSRLYQFDPSERPCSSPGGGCIFTFATWYVFSTLRIICASIFFCPLFFQKFEKAKNYSDLIPPTSQPFFILLLWYLYCMYNTNCPPLAPPKVYLYASKDERREVY